MFCAVTVMSRATRFECGPGDVWSQCQIRRRRSGLPAGIGSVETTSSAAPAIVPCRNASDRSCSFTKAPRAVLMK